MRFVIVSNLSLRYVYLLWYLFLSICNIVMSKWQSCNVWTLESVCESVDNNLGRKKALLANFIQHDFHSQKRVSIV